MHNEPTTNPFKTQRISCHRLGGDLRLEMILCQDQTLCTDYHAFACTVLQAVSIIHARGAPGSYAGYSEALGGNSCLQAHGPGFVQKP
jgi:hypothetical protein